MNKRIIKKQVIASLAMLVFAGTCWAQNTELIAALDSNIGGSAHRTINLPVPQHLAPAPRVQIEQLISVGDHFTDNGHLEAAVQTYMRASVIAGMHGLDAVTESVERKLGAAFWNLSEQGTDPDMAFIARAFWSIANLSGAPYQR